MVSTSLNGEGKNKNLKQIEDNEIILDVGINTLKNIKKIINKSHTILWNGPAGYLRIKIFLMEQCL